MSEHQDLITRLTEASERYRARDFDAAQALCQQLLEEIPNQPDALNMTALIARATKKWGRAEEIAREGLQVHPESAILHNTLGLITLDQRRLDEAETLFRRAVQLKPEHGEIQVNLGRVLHEIGAFDEAKSVLTKVIDRFPLPNALILRAAISIECGRFDAASDDIEAAASMNANHGELCNAKALLAFAQGRLDDAYGFFDQVIRDATDVADARVNRGVIRLLQGRIKDGWEDYAMRHKRRWARSVKRPFPYPDWHGEDLSGKTLLVWGEQGLGETILCGSLIPHLLGEAGHLVLECNQRLVRLFQQSFPEAKIVVQTDPPGEALKKVSVDYVSSAFDVLLHRCPDLSQQGIPSAYLKADENQVHQLRDKYKSVTNGKFLVGLSWGSPKAANARMKGVAPENWSDLLNVPDVAFVNLQYGAGREAMNDVAAQSGATLISDPDIDQDSDLDQAANQIAALDMVITVSNTTAHLAGALGQLTWVILPPIGPGSSWYWFVGREDSPWYPQVQLFRRDYGAGNDAALLRSLGSDLTALIRG